MMRSYLLVVLLSFLFSLSTTASTLTGPDLTEQEIKAILRKNEPTVILPFTFAGLSQDPLKGFLYKNKWAMPLLYEKPIVRNDYGFYYSEILKKFDYDVGRKQLSLILKDNVYFSDGRKLVLEDLVWGLKRAAYLKPDLYVSSAIEGLADWHSQKNPLSSLPSGIKKRSPDLLTISFSRPIENPFNMLEIHLFDLLPHDCFDKSNGDLICQNPPSLGNYLLLEKRENFLSFGLWRKKEHLPKKINYLFIPPGGESQS